MRFYINKSSSSYNQVAPENLDTTKTKGSEGVGNKSSSFSYSIGKNILAGVIRVFRPATGTVRGLFEGAAQGATMGSNVVKHHSTDHIATTVAKTSLNTVCSVIGGVGGAAAGAAFRGLEGLKDIVIGKDVFVTPPLGESYTSDEFSKIKEDNRAGLINQFEVAFDNYNKAVDAAGIDGSNRLSEKFKQGKIQEINDRFHNCKTPSDINKVIKFFSKVDGKKDDFGFEAKFKKVCESCDPNKFKSKGTFSKPEVDPKSIFAQAQIDAINERGNDSTVLETSNSFSVADQTYSTTVKCVSTNVLDDTKNFSCSGDKKNGTVCKNLHYQTLDIDSTSKSGSTAHVFRHGAINGDGDPKQTAVPGLEPAQSVDDFFSELLSVNITSDNVQQALSLMPSDIKTSIESELKNDGTLSKATKKQFTRQCALLNKVSDLAKSMAKEGKGVNADGTLTLTSLSLVTPDDVRGHEKHLLHDQVEAFDLLKGMKPDQLKQLGFEGVTEVKVAAFNFGVNEGEFMGRTNSADANNKAMTALEAHTQDAINSLNSKIKEATGSEKTKLQVQLKTIQSVQADIKTRFSAYNSSTSLWKADQAYQLTSRIAFLTELTGGANAANCASGKDRTGMHVSLSLNYAIRMRAQMERMETSINSSDNSSDNVFELSTKDNIDEIRDLNKQTSKSTKDQPRLQTLYQENRTLMSETLQQWVQTKNTGSPGFKLQTDKKINWLTKGDAMQKFDSKKGNTETFFMEMCGFKTVDEVHAFINMRSPFNKI